MGHDSLDPAGARGWGGYGLYQGSPGDSHGIPGILARPGA